MAMMISSLIPGGAVRYHGRTSVPRTLARVGHLPQMQTQTQTAFTAASVGDTAEMCECGLPAVVDADGAGECARCRALDGDRRAWLVDVLRDYEPRTLQEISRDSGYSVRAVLRNLKPLLASGRVRRWLEERDTVFVRDEPHRRFGWHSRAVMSYAMYALSW